MSSNAFCHFKCLCRSLSSRKLDMWFEDHHGGIMEGTYVRSNATLCTDNDYWKVRSSTTEKYEHR